MLQFARGLPKLPTPKGENVVIITGAGGSGVLLSDACVDNGLQLMKMPPDLDAAFRKFIPPFGAAGNPVDITGGEPPVFVKGRSTRPPQSAWLSQSDGQIEVELIGGEDGVSPGQACVFYDAPQGQARVLGGGFIQSAGAAAVRGDVGAAALAASNG
jgi:hypothetical protein